MINDRSVGGARPKAALRSVWSQRGSVRWAARLVSLAASPTLVPLWLGLILIGAAIFRFAGLDWDQGQHLHPDERFLTLVETGMRWPSDHFLTSYFNEATSTLNPVNVGYGFFVYGDLPVILVKGISAALHQSGYDQVYLVGRVAEALFDIGSIQLLFLLARTLYNDRRVALLASLLYAMTALAIQQAHFFVVDGFSAFFVTAALYFMARVLKAGRLRDYLLAGACIGLALACKISVYSVAQVLLIVAVYRLSLGLQDPNRSLATEVGQTAGRLLASAAVAFVAFRLFQPYAFAGPGLFGLSIAPRWLHNLLEARAWETGVRDAPFAWQWTERAPILFPLRNMMLWGLGLPLGVTCWIGWGVACWRLVRRQQWAHLIPVAWTAILVLLVGTQWVKSMRYFLPIYPALVLLGAWLLVWLWDQAKSRSRSSALRWTLPRAGALIGAVLIGTTLYAMALTSIYLRPHTRVEASRWIYAHVPAGTIVANETAWDDALPLRVDGQGGPGTRYRGLDLDITAEDSPQKMQQVLNVLDRANYLFISSNRQYDSMVRLPTRFPMVAKYYGALFHERLGFKRVAEFTSYPSLLGIRLPDQGAEESWSVYDHPRVQIFEKTASYSHAQAAAILGNVAWDQILPLTPRQATRTHNAELLTPLEQLSYQAAGSWHRMFDAASIVNRFPVFFWMLAVFLIGMAGMPYVWLVAAPLADRGFAFVKPVGLLLIGWLTWWLASLKVLPFTRGTILLALLAVGAGATGITLSRRVAFGNWLRANLRLLLIEEGLFWTFFAMALLVRWANPDLWHPSLGGEKPMDFAFLNAVLKSVYFPPYDPWFAGGYMNYYYFGFVLVGTLVKLTGVVPAVAYNLAIPTLFAFLASAAFGSTLSLLPQGEARPRSRWRPILFGLLGAVLIVLIGNLGELRLALNVLGGRAAALRPESWYWDASRIIHHPATEAGPITEFPAFSFLYADLHAHVMALPYTAVVVGLTLTFIREQPGPWDRLVSAARLVLLAIAIGALWPLNTWDFPTYALVALAALVIHGVRRRGLGLKTLAGALARWVVLLVLGYLLFLPFHQHYAAPKTGLDIWRGSRTSLGDYLTAHGIVLFIIASALLVDLWSARDLNPVARLIRLGLSRWNRLRRLRRLHRLLVSASPTYRAGVFGAAGGCVLSAVLALAGLPAPALIVLLMTLVGLLIVRRSRPRSTSLVAATRPLWSMTLMLVMIGLALTMAVEFVVAKNIDIGRMNTVFKLYLQAWMLWGLAAAAAALVVWQRLPRFRLRWRVAWLGAFAGLLGAGLLYPILATPGKIADRFDRSVGPTLDGMVFMDRAILADHNHTFRLVYDEQAIRWVQQNVPGSPVFAEVSTYPTLYGWGNRYAMFTGNPAVIGWDWHERQQRALLPASVVMRRVADIQQAYATRDPIQAYRIFTQYGVRYFVVGPLEQTYFPGGQGKWDARQGTLWNLVYQNPGVRIYQVVVPASSDTPADVAEWPGR